MSDRILSDKIWTEETAVERIFETVKKSERGKAPFALVLGAGFSHGLVSTARQLVTNSLPLWMKSIDDEKAFEEVQQGLTPTESEQVAATFWKHFVERNAKHGLELELGSKGLPENHPAAYQAAFDPRYDGAVGAPADARTFQRALMRLDAPRLNAAHFLLASILGVQPGRKRESALFNAKAAFSRLILTTNFDPFLQIALQSVNRLYVMSDTPDLGLGDEVFDDQVDAIHLVYLHGTIHRRAQKATQDEIGEIKAKNARILEPVLKRHGIIVLGYSGWDDAIVDALAGCESFDHRLYWCGTKPDPSVKGAFGDRVAEVLRKPSAFYVKIDSAGQFMARLCAKFLRNGAPPLLENPIRQLREMIEVIDLQDLEAPLAVAPSLSEMATLAKTSADRDTFHQAQQLVIHSLKRAEDMFFGPRPTSEGIGAGVAARGQVEAGAGGADRETDRLLSSARIAEALGNVSETLRLCGAALARNGLGPVQKAELLLIRGRAHFFSANSDAAVDDWSELIRSMGAPTEQVAVALINRGMVFVMKGEGDKARADYTRVCEMADVAPIEHVVGALNSRGMSWLQAGDVHRALADFTQILETFAETQVDFIAMALNNRGMAWFRIGEFEKALADFTRVLDELRGAPAAQVAVALNSRAMIFAAKGAYDSAIADFTRVIEAVPVAPTLTVAIALNGRGAAWRNKGEIGKALTDFTRVIDVPGATVEQLAVALNFRGRSFGEQGAHDDAIADLTRVVEALPGAPPEAVAIALNNRGIVWSMGNQMAQALADFSRIIDGLPGAPVEQIANALIHRAWVLSKQGKLDKALSDLAKVVDALPGASDQQVKLALETRAGLGAHGDAPALRIR